jgi:hypothetical protein
MTPAAVRKRKRRAAERESRVASSAASARSYAAPVVVQEDQYIPPPLGPVTVSETVPVEGPGADAFLMEPAAVEGEPAPEPAAESVPLVEPAPVPPPPAPPAPVPADEKTVKAIGAFVGGFFSSGVIALFETSPGFVRFVSGMAGSPDAAFAYLPMAVGLVSSSAEELARLYRLRLPYQDHLVVALALGVGGYGLARKQKILADLRNAQNANAQPAAVADAAPAAPPVDVATAPPTMPAPAPPRLVDDEGDEVAA